MTESYCHEHTNKLGNHEGRLGNLETHRNEDINKRELIFEEIKTSNIKINDLDKKITVLSSRFEGFQKNMKDNYREFKEDMTSLINKVFLKLSLFGFAAIIMLKIIDSLFKIGGK